MKIILTTLIVLTCLSLKAQENYYAHIENGKVTSVEVVMDDFFNANPLRYSGTWKKVGTQTQPYIGIGDTLIEEKNLIIIAKPYNSWILDKDNIWQAPKARPSKGRYTWDESTLNWVAF